MCVHGKECGCSGGRRKALWAEAVGATPIMEVALQRKLSCDDEATTTWPRCSISLGTTVNSNHRKKFEGYVSVRMLN